MHHLLLLPLELRYLVYDAYLGLHSTKDLDRLKILLVCHQIYNELAIRLYSTTEFSLPCDGPIKNNAFSALGKIDRTLLRSIKLISITSSRFNFVPMLRQLHAKRERPNVYKLIWSPPVIDHQGWSQDERCDAWVNALDEIANKNPHTMIVKPVQILNKALASLNARFQAHLKADTNSSMTNIISRYNDRLGHGSVLRMEEVNDADGAAGWESVCTTSEGDRKGARVKVKRFEFIQT